MKNSAKKQTAKTIDAPVAEGANLPVVAQPETPMAVAMETAVQAGKSVRVALTQENSKGKIMASFVFGAQGADLNDFLTDTARRIVGVMKIQQRIKERGGKSNVFGLTKGGNFELGITVAEQDGAGVSHGRDERVSVKQMHKRVESMKKLHLLTILNIVVSLVVVALILDAIYHPREQTQEFKPEYIEDAHHNEIVPEYVIEIESSDSVWIQTETRLYKVHFDDISKTIEYDNL